MQQYVIQSEMEYQQVMEQIEHYLRQSTLQGGMHTLSPAEKRHLQQLSIQAETWEDKIPIMPIPKPKTLIEMLEFKMYERKMKQKDLAALLDISTTRLSEVLQGKRKVNMDLAKKMHSILEIDARFILENA